MTEPQRAKTVDEVLFDEWWDETTRGYKPSTATSAFLILSRNAWIRANEFSALREASYMKMLVGVAKENKALRDALLFYGDRPNYNSTVKDAGCGCCSVEIDPAVLTDGGDQARAALALPRVVTSLDMLIPREGPG